MYNTQKLPEVIITAESLIEDVQNGLSWYAKDDIGYGSIQEKYDARDFQIKIIQQHPMLRDVTFVPPTKNFVIISGPIVNQNQDSELNLDGLSEAITEDVLKEEDLKEDIIVATTTDFDITSEIENTASEIENTVAEASLSAASAFFKL